MFVVIALNICNIQQRLTWGLLSPTAKLLWTTSPVSYRIGLYLFHISSENYGATLMYIVENLVLDFLVCLGLKCRDF